MPFRNTCNKSAIVAYFSAISDHREDVRCPPPKPIDDALLGYSDEYPSKRRDRKAPRMAARRKSRRMREIARWQDACFGA